MTVSTTGNEGIPTLVTATGNVKKWLPLPQMQHAKVIKSFLPLNKQPSLNSTGQFYKNLYYGDEMFLFETHGEKWARGYLIVQPLPVDFIEKSSDLEKLPELTVSVVIVPWKCVKKLDSYPLASTFSPPDQSDFEHDGSNVPSIYELETSRMKEELSEKLHLKPPLPLVRLQVGDLLDELIPSLNQLSSHIFSLYSVSEYGLYIKLYQIFTELSGLRLQLFNDLLTIKEAGEVKKQISASLTKVAKLLSSKGTNKFSKSSSSLKTDPSGFEAITARDIDSGELYNYQNPDLSQRPIPKFIAANQIASAFQPNFPIQNTLVSDMTPVKRSRFDRVTPSQILVDFRDVVGTSSLNPKGFIGMTAYMYLRSPRKRLTEAFAIHINQSTDFNLDSISAALFRNIPGTEVISSRVYLVAIITERIQMPLMGGSKSVEVLNYYRKGIAAGATDISRVFARRDGSLKEGRAHDFSIKLFGSYVNSQDNTTMDPSNTNFGWGELVDRIIKGTRKGVAVNPRAEKLVVSIKEFRDDLQNVENAFEQSVKTPVNQIRTCSYDPLIRAPHDRVYFTVGKVNLYQQPSSVFPGDLVSLQLVNEDPESDIGISKATNDETTTFWNFTSVYSNEVVGEMIKFSNFSYMKKRNESFKLKLFVNGELKSKLDLPVVVNGQIFEHRKNSLLIFKDSTGQKFASVEVSSEYIGKTFNIQDCFLEILNFERYFQLPHDEDKLIDSLKKLNQTKLSELIKFFKPLIPKILQIFQLAGKDPSLTKLRSASYYSFIHLLDVVIARDEQFTYLYHEFIREIHDYHLPKVGISLLSLTADYFRNVENEWNFIGRTLCRVLPLLLKISSMVVIPLDWEKWKDHFESLLTELEMFINLPIDKNVLDQLSIIDNFDLVVNNLYEDKVFLVDESVNIFVRFINSIRVSGPINDHSEESKPINNGGNVALKSREAKIMMCKLLLIRRIINSWVMKCSDSTTGDLPTTSVKFYYSAINWSIETFDLFEYDIETLRLANSTLVSICNVAWSMVITKRNHSIPINLSRILVKIADIFISVHRYTRTKHYFTARRTYTQIFPNGYPFNDMIIDSIVNETVLVEVLVELAVIYSFVTKVAKGVLHEFKGKHDGLLTILEMSSSSTDFGLSEDINFSNGFTKDDLLTLIHMNRLLVASSFYPHTKWISLYSLFIEATTSASELLQAVMIKQYIPDISNTDQFDRLLWSKFLKSILSVANSTPAAICHLSEVPRKAAFKITEDVRTRCALVVNRCWDYLGWDSLERDYVRFQLKKCAGFHAEFLDSEGSNEFGILEELMVFCLQRNSQCQIVGVKVLWSILVAEILVRESVVKEEGDDDEVNDEDDRSKLIHVERECLLALNKFYRSKRYTPSLYEQGNFLTRLQMMIRLDPEDITFPEVYQFTRNLTMFLEIQYDLTTVPTGEEFDDERTFHQLDIARHLMRVNTVKKFYSTLADLFEMNLQRDNHTQAALCLELIASAVGPSWDPNELLPEIPKPYLPAQSAFERKETLYLQIGHYLTMGKKYEKAVLVYKELAEAYEHYRVNLKGLSFIHSELGKLYASLEDVDREAPTYFKVTFIGLGFPNTLTSRTFVYEGLPFEHITSIHTRLLRLHTGAKIIRDDDPMLSSDYKKTPPPGKFLHIVTVKPQMDVNQSSAMGSSLTTAERSYFENKSLTFFTTSRRLTQSTENVLELWVEETTYETYDRFPTLMNRSEVRDVSVVKLSPIRNALRTLGDKVRDLVNLENSVNNALKLGGGYSGLDGVEFSALSRNLSGTVDSPVNGGIAQYKEFFNQPLSNAVDLEEYENDLALLRLSFDNLAICIYRCLLAQGKCLPSSDFIPVHKSMISLFSQNFKEEIENTGIVPEDLYMSIKVISMDSSSESASNSSANSSLRKFHSSTQSSAYNTPVSPLPPLTANINRKTPGTSSPLHLIQTSSATSISPLNRTDTGISDQLSTSRGSALTDLSSGSHNTSATTTINPLLDHSGVTGNVAANSARKKSLLGGWRNSRVN